MPLLDLAAFTVFLPRVVAAVVILVVGAVALATGLAFGLGGREVAGQELREWRDQVRSGEANASASSATPPVTP